MDRALIVDDVAAGREIAGKELSKAGFVVETETCTDAALEFLRGERLDLVVASHRQPGIDAIEFIRRLRKVSDVPIVVLAAVPSIEDCEMAMRVGADRFLRLGVGVARLGEVARQLLVLPISRSGAIGELTREEARALGQNELRSLLQRLVVECRGNIAEIARRMNRDRSTVRYHLRRMDMLD